MKAVLVHNYFRWYNPVTWLYALIRKITGSYWNHAVIWINIEGVECLIDANFNGIMVRGDRLNIYNKQSRIVAILDIPTEIKEQELKRRVISLANKKYDFKVYLRYLLKYVFGIILNRPNNSYYCFELLGTVWKENFNTENFLTGKDFEPYIKQTVVLPSNT